MARTEMVDRIDLVTRFTESRKENSLHVPNKIKYSEVWPKSVSAT